MRNLTALQDARTAAFDFGAGEGSLQLAVGLSSRYLLSPAGCVVAVDDGGGVLQWECVLAVPPSDDATPQAAGANTNEQPQQQAHQAGWMHLSFVGESDLLLAAHSGGALVTLSAAGGGSHELVGQFEGGIEAMTWSADQSRLLVVTGLHVMLVLSTQWDVLTEITCAPFIGRCAASAAPAPSAAAPAPSSPESHAVAAAWRSDAAHVVVSCFDAATRRRQLRIYSQDLASVALGRNEDGSAVEGLQAAVAWSPDGALVAAGMVVPSRKRLQVAFFETNGLRHRELVIPGFPHDAVEVQWVGWNADCDILGVVLAALAGVPATRRVLQLWHRDNYHWYLKREEEHGELGDALQAVTWDPEQAYRMHGVVRRGPAGGGSSSIGGPSRLLCALRTVDLCWDFCTSPADSRALPQQAALSSGGGKQRLPRGVVTACVGEGGTSRISLCPSWASVPPPLAYLTLQLEPTGGQLAGRGAAAPLEVVFAPEEGAALDAAPPAADACGSNPLLHRLALLSGCGAVVQASILLKAPRDTAPQKQSQSPAAPVAPTTASEGGSSLAITCGLAHDCGGGVLLAASVTPLVGVPIPGVLGADVEMLLRPGEARSPGALPQQQQGGGEGPWGCSEPSAFRVDPRSLRQLVWLQESPTPPGPPSPPPQHPHADTVAAAHTSVDPAPPSHSIFAVITSRVTSTSAAAEAATTPPSSAASADCILFVRTGAPVAPSAPPVPTSGGVPIPSSPALECALLFPPPGLAVLRISPLRGSSGSGAPERGHEETSPSDPWSPPLVALLSDGTLHLLSIQWGRGGAASPAPRCRASFHARLPERTHWLLPLSLREQPPAPHPEAASRPSRRVTVVLSLSRSGRLYADGCLLSPAIAPHGVSWHSGHRLLLLATQGPSSQLAYLSEPEVLDAALGGGGSKGLHALHAALQQAPQFLPEYAGVAPAGADAVWSRPLERGARIVCVDPATDCVTLQMPRGNTETVTPRALTLASIRSCLDARPIPLLGAAIELARKHRVDMNVLYDHCPPIFADGHCMAAAVRQVAACSLSAAEGSASTRRKAAAAQGHDRWDLLLSALAEEDVTGPKGKYAPPPHCAPPPPLPAAAACDAVEAALLVHADPSLAAAAASDNKVTRACGQIRRALLRAMISSGADTGGGGIPWCHPLVLAVCTSFARQVPADLESLLRTVQRATEHASAAKKRPSGGAAGAGPTIPPEAVLAHAIVVCDSDVELLYATALGLYDVPLAGLLAQQGQADPREYGPLLASLTRTGAEGQGGEPGAGGGSAAASPAPESPLLPWAGLSNGQLRQRWAVDVHLGRWRRAVTWAVGMSARELLQQRPSPGGGAPLPLLPPHPPQLDEAGFVAALAAPLPPELAALIQVGIERPTHTALALCASRSPAGQQLAAAASLWATAGLPRVSRVAAIVGAWLTLGSDAPASSSTAPPAAAAAVTGEALAALAEATRRGTRGAHEALLLAFCPTGAIRALRSGSPPSHSRVTAALDVLLWGVSPPAADDALALACALAGDPGMEYRGAPLWRLALTLASLPTSVVRRQAKGWPPLAFGSVLLGLGQKGAAEPPPSAATAAATSPPPPFPVCVLLPLLPVPSYREVARALAGLLGQGRTPAAAHAAALLLIEHCGEVEEGVAALCSPASAGPASGSPNGPSGWMEAARYASAHARLDLLETLILPALEEAAAAAVGELEERGEALREAVGRLARCRSVRAAAPLLDLVGRAEAGAVAVALGGWGAGPLGEEEGAGGGPGGGGDDAASAAPSLWSDAPSIVSGAGGSLASSSGAGKTVASAASRGSSSSRMSAVSAGRFSHLSHTVLPAHFITPKSLRLSEGDLSAAQVAALGDRSVETAMGRRERKEGGERGAAIVPQAGKGGGGGDATAAAAPRRKGRQRPGSRGDEKALEEEVWLLLPCGAPGGGAGTRLTESLQALCANLLLFGRSAALRRVERAYAALQASIGVRPGAADGPGDVIAPFPAPVPRTRTVRRLADSHGVSVEQLLAAAPQLAPVAAEEEELDVTAVLGGLGAAEAVGGGGEAADRIARALSAPLLV